MKKNFLFTITFLFLYTTCSSFISLLLVMKKSLIFFDGTKIR